jgi:polysaccharide deacetylase family protein (PEP-CTERM system associated)
MKCIFSIDVEDWFHILDLPNTPEMAQWDRLPSRVEQNFGRLLEILGQYDAKATCFFIGWIAQKYPHLVHQAIAQGHEVASHGYQHKLAYEMTSEEFFEDAVRSKRVIEDIAGQRVLGYRASGFSVTNATPWFFDRLIEAGYDYDSSVFPAKRAHGGLLNGRYAPYQTGSANFVEFPATIKNVWGSPVCFSGGGYLRLAPYWVIRTMTRRVLRENRPAIFYVHPREIDVVCPRLPMGLTRRFKSYVNVATTEAKIRGLLCDFKMVTFREYLVNTVDIFTNSVSPILRPPIVREKNSGPEGASA